MRKFFFSLIHVSDSVISAPAHTVPVLCLGVQNHAELVIAHGEQKALSEYEFADRSVISGARQQPVLPLVPQRHFLVSGVEARTSTGTKLHRSHNAVASMASGQWTVLSRLCRDSTHPSLLL